MTNDDAAASSHGNIPGADGARIGIGIPHAREDVGAMRRCAIPPYAPRLGRTVGTVVRRRRIVDVFVVVVVVEGGRWRTTIREEECARTMRDRTDPIEETAYLMMRDAHPRRYASNPRRANFAGNRSAQARIGDESGTRDTLEGCCWQGCQELATTTMDGDGSLVEEAHYRRYTG